MRILITGNEGFVGRNFTKYFHNHPKYSKATIVGCDIKSGYDCRDLFRKSGEQFDLVIHLAAIVGGRMTIEYEPMQVATDLAIDADMFNWAVRTKQPRVVYFSSSAAYPIALQQKAYFLKESDISFSLNRIGVPDYTYGWTKLTGEYLASFAKKEGVKVYVTRPFSGYGNDQDLTYPFPSFIQRGREQQAPFEIWGNGLQVRDFIHIDDIVRITMKMVEEDYQEPLNLGCGRPTDFWELAQMVMEEAGYLAGIAADTSKPIGVRYRCADTTKLFAFEKPKISLEEGIRRALNG